jgi:hypothetical protein
MLQVHRAIPGFPSSSVRSDRLPEFGGAQAQGKYHRNIMRFAAFNPLTLLAPARCVSLGVR